MVAIAGAGWRLSPSLVAMFAEAELWADLMDLYASPEESLVALSGLADVYATRTVEALRKAGVIA